MSHLLGWHGTHPHGYGSYHQVKASSVVGRTLDASEFSTIIPIATSIMSDCGCLKFEGDSWIKVVHELWALSVARIHYNNAWKSFDWEAVVN